MSTTTNLKNITINKNYSSLNLSNEIFKDVLFYEELYQISNFGNVKSLARRVEYKGGYYTKKERILKPKTDRYGYYVVNLSKNSVVKTRKIHQLVAVAFLGHDISDVNLSIDHVNFIKTDNSVKNLKVLSCRENSSKRKNKTTSKYIGVRWDKAKSKWLSRIMIKGKLKFLGYFKCEYEASIAYQKALKEHGEVKRSTININMLN